MPPATPSVPYARCSDVPFENVVRFFTCFVRAKKAGAKGRQLAEFREKNVPRPSDDLYQIYRLLLPLVSLDSYCVGPSTNNTVS